MAKIKQSFVHYPGNDNIYEVVDEEARETKQNKLVSGSNIKTINNKTILGSGNIQTLTPEQLGQPNGVAQLDKDGFIPGNLIPNAYDDIVDGTFVNDTTFNGANGNPVIPAKNKIYYDTTTLKRYGWSGTKFVEFSGSGLILGDIEGTAYDGAKGKQNETDIANLKNDKLDKVAEQEKVYATDGLGSQTTIQYNVEPYGDGLAKRTGDGRVKGNEGTEANDLVNKTQLDKKTNYQGTHLKEGLESIIDKKTFYKYFYDKRNEPTQNYVIEGGSEQTPTNENIITALGGFPDGFKRKSHWFILINLLGNSNNHLTNGITLELLLRGSVENDFYQMFIHSYNGTNGTYDSGWQNIKGKAITQATEKDLGGVRVKTATDDQTDFVGIDSKGLLKVKPSGGAGGGIVPVGTLPTPTQEEFDKGALFLQNNELYFLAINNFKEQENAPTPSVNFQWLFEYNNLIYLIGQDHNLYTYNPATNTYTTLVGDMPDLNSYGRISSFNSLVVGNISYLLGTDGALYKLDLTNNQVVVVPTTGKKINNAYLGVILYKNVIYSFGSDGGYGSTSGYSTKINLDTFVVESFNLPNSFVKSRPGKTFGVYDGKLIIAGSVSNNLYIVYEFNTETNELIPLVQHKAISGLYYEQSGFIIKDNAYYVDGIKFYKQSLKTGEISLVGESSFYLGGYNYKYCLDQNNSIYLLGGEQQGSHSPEQKNFKFDVLPTYFYKKITSVKVEGEVK